MLSNEGYKEILIIRLEVPDWILERWQKGIQTSQDDAVIDEKVSQYFHAKFWRAETIRNVSIGIIVLSVLMMIGCGIVGLWRGGSKPKGEGKPLELNRKGIGA